MRIFVTGGTGFIGRHVVKRLVQKDYEPICLVRATSNTSELEKMGVTLVTGDVTNKVSLAEFMVGCDWVVNLANIYSWWEPDKRIYTRVNVEGTRNVMECALETGISKVAHISTAYVYGKPGASPFIEDTPVGSVRPSYYTRTKYEGDLVALQFSKTRGLPLVIIYPGTVVGSGDPKAIGRYIKRLVANLVPNTAFPNAVHTYVYVGDVTEAIVLALEKEDNLGEKYLIGKYHLSNLELAELLSDISGVRVPPKVPVVVSLLISTIITLLADLKNSPPNLPPLDYMRVIREGCVFDGSKAQKELGLEYTSIHDILKEVVEYEKH
jgi:dihydroflavonol-4-reductase